MTDTLARSEISGVRSGTRDRWMLWGVLAGLGGVVANLVTAPVVQGKDRANPERVVALMDSTTYHLAAVAGYVAAAAVLLFAAGLRAWGQRQPTRSPAISAAVFGIVASAGAMIAGYGVKGQLAEYLPGGVNADNYGTDALYTYFLLDDLAGFFGWFGVAVAAGCLAWLSFRERLIPRWIGVLLAAMVIVPAGLLLAFGFSGFAGVICPVLLIPSAIGMYLQRA